MASSDLSITVAGHQCQWEWEGEKSVWQQYPIDIQQEISKAYDSGKSEVKKNKKKQDFHLLIHLGRC